MRSCYPFLLAATLVCAPRLMAQEPPTPVPAAVLEPGTHVRITLEDSRNRDRIRGYLQALDATGSTFEVRQDSLVTLTLPVETVTRVERSLGRRSNALVGAAVLGGLGLAASLPFCLDDETAREYDCGRILAALAGGGALVGALAGLVMKSEKWEELPLSVLHAGASAGGGLGLVVTFPGP
ncbi:MAG: hypothetical protein ABFS14_13470 [Gemmatimonadota bacterium]